MINPRNFIDLVYVSENLEDMSLLDVLNSELLDYLQVKGMGGLEFFSYAVKRSTWTGGSILKYVIVDNSVDCKGLVSEILRPEINGSICHVIKLGAVVDEDNNLTCFKQAEKACKFIVDDIMDFDWELFMWSKSNMDICFQNIAASQGISNIDKFLYYRRSRGLELPIWAMTAQELLSIQSLSLRSGVWQHYDGLKMNDRIISIGKYIKSMGAVFGPLSDAYLSCVGKNGPSKNTDKFDILISKNEELFDVILIGIYNRNKTEMYSWCN